MSARFAARRCLRFVVLAIGAPAICFCPAVASATEQFYSTVIRQSNGKWACPEEFTRDLVIIGPGGREHTLGLHELFSGKDYHLHVAETTAGPLWGQNSLYYLVELNGATYLTMHTCYGKRLLINLDAGKIEDPTSFADALREADKKEIRSTLAKIRALIAEKKGGWNHEKLHGAMLLAAKYKMADVRGDLEDIEQHVWGSAWTDFGPNFEHGLTLDLRSTGYDEKFTRRFAQVALRRLGFAPKGYPQVIFERNKEYRAISPEERLHKTAGLKVGRTAQQVYELLGPPDYIEDFSKQGIDAWRFDWGPQPDFSLVIVWDKAGNVVEIKKIAPGLWHGDELFSQESRPAFGPDGSLGRGQIRSRAFRAKVTDFLSRDDKAK